MALQLVGIGGLGLMLNPSAKHLTAEGPARFLRMHDRGTADARRDACRRSWQAHGARLVGDFESLVGEDDYDGVVVCAGKNGDDRYIFRELLPLMTSKGPAGKFILHLSTVSAGFTRAAYEYCRGKGVDYVNYPLTGGPLGAESATMLILASGDASVYAKLEPLLQTIGTPRYLGSGVSAGAQVKLIGQLMVFNGLVGICSAAALKSACFQETLSGIGQADFFDFLNGGAGGTRQWDVAASKGVRDNIWNQGFMIHHAVVDAIYAAKLCCEIGLPAFTVIPMAAVALAFAYLLDKYPGAPLATHAIMREMIQHNAAGLDAFINRRLNYNDVDASIQSSIEVLPQQVKDSVMLDIDPNSFEP